MILILLRIFKYIFSLIFIIFTEMMIANSSRLSYDEKVETSYRVRMILNIRHFHQSDVGTYECRCRNEHGEAASFIGLHGRTLN